MLFESRHRSYSNSNTKWEKNEFQMFCNGIFCDVQSIKGVRCARVCVFQWKELRLMKLMLTLPFTFAFNCELFVFFLAIAWVIRCCLRNIITSINLRIGSRSETSHICFANQWPNYRQLINLDGKILNALIIFSKHIFTSSLFLLSKEMVMLSKFGFDKCFNSCFGFYRRFFGSGPHHRHESSFLKSRFIN